MEKLRYLVPVAAAALIGTAQAGTNWAVDNEASTVRITFEQQGSKYKGEFDDFTAEIDFDPSAPAAGKIIGVVVTDSVDSRDYDRDAQMTDVDFLNSAEFPEARFESESIEAADDGTFVANGELTLKGTTRPVELTFSFDESGDTATFDGSMKINRFDFKVGEGWNDTSFVGQDVEVEIELDLSRAESS